MRRSIPAHGTVPGTAGRGKPLRRRGGSEQLVQLAVLDAAEGPPTVTARQRRHLELVGGEGAIGTGQCGYGGAERVGHRPPFGPGRVHTPGDRLGLAPEDGVPLLVEDRPVVEDVVELI